MTPKRYALADSLTTLRVRGSKKSSSARRKALIVRRNNLISTRSEREVVIAGEGRLHGLGCSSAIQVLLLDGIPLLLQEYNLVG